MATNCLSCEIVSGRRPVPCGAVAETEHFHCHQDVAYPVPGLIIVAAKRHFRLLTEMTAAESAALIPLLQRIRRAQAAVLGVEHAYFFYNEDTKHHFHVWVVPRYDWMRAFGKSIDSVRPALLHARKADTPDFQPPNLERVASELKRELIR